MEQFDTNDFQNIDSIFVIFARSINADVNNNSTKRIGGSCTNIALADM